MKPWQRWLTLCCILLGLGWYLHTLRSASATAGPVLVRLTVIGQVVGLPSTSGPLSLMFDFPEIPLQKRVFWDRVEHPATDRFQWSEEFRVYALPQNCRVTLERPGHQPTQTGEIAVREGEVEVGRMDYPQTPLSPAVAAPTRPWVRRTPGPATRPRPGDLSAPFDPHRNREGERPIR